MAEKTPSSPDSLQLRGAPLASARLSKKAALVAVAVLAGVLAIVIANVSKEQPAKAADDADAKKPLEPALTAAQTLTRDVPDALENETAPRHVAPTLSAPVASSGARRRTSEDEARLADTAVAKFSADSAASAPPQVRASSTAREGSADDADVSERDLNGQAQKLAFVNERHETAYLQHRVTPPRSAFELKTGTVIPGILLSEVSSDLPGELIAQVSQNVYDTATGNHVLIPQGAKLFGRYDSQVTFGQGRVLIVWQRLVFPDASTLELDGMSGHDQSGQAGFEDRVNNHYLRIFGAALFTSALSAGYQLSQPRQDRNSVNSLPSDRQVVAGAVGQQVAELGVEIARRNLQVQPTIQIRKGYRLNVMVNKDVVFPESSSR